jgi:hypothetical protein
VKGALCELRLDGVLRSWTSVLRDSRKSSCPLLSATFRASDALGYLDITNSIDHHAAELRQNTAANATWTGRIGTRTPEKAGSVSKETQPRAPEISTKAPRALNPSFRDAARPINVKPANSPLYSLPPGKEFVPIPPHRRCQAGLQGSPTAIPLRSLGHFVM